MTETLESLIGEKLVIGFPGTKITPEVVQQFKGTHAGGVIFYRINFESPEQLKSLITDLENALGRKLLVCVDHEGGRVVMYREGVTVFPDNLTVGHAGQVSYATQMGEIAAKELRALGTDVNFAPVLDILTDAYSPNIGIRSYGDNWEKVAELGTAYINALQKGGVSATAKHFPGKGHAPYDAHIKLPTINSTWEEMKNLHLKPFVKAIEAGVDVVMSSHPYYPRLDPDPKHIATFSRRIITDCLRDELKFKGVISSDDLEMGAVHDVCPIDTAAVRAVAAGHDLILSCHDYESEKKVFNGLVEAYKNKLLPVPELEESVDRIRALKAKRKERFEGAPRPHQDGERLAFRIALDGVRVLKDDNKVLPLSNEDRSSLCIIFPLLSEFSPKIMIEEEFENEEDYLTKKFAEFGCENTQTSLYHVTPNIEEIENSLAQAKQAETTIFFCFDAHLYPGEQPLLAALQKVARQLVVILLRDPYDQSFIQKNTLAITAFGFRRRQIEAAINKIFCP